MRALLLALLLGGTAGAVPLCRVTADSRPLWWASTLRVLTVRLAPDCPADGQAVIRLGGYGGPGSQAVGRRVTLNAARRAVNFSGQPIWRSVLWEALSGRLYQVAIPQEAKRAEDE